MNYPVKKLFFLQQLTCFLQDFWTSVGGWTEVHWTKPSGQRTIEKKPKRS